MKFFPTVAIGAGSIRKSLFKSARAAAFSARSVSAPRRAGLLLTAALLFIAFFLSISVWRGSSVSAFAESITVVSSSDCQTPQSSFQLGQSACARVTGAPLSNRRVIWVAPDGTVAQVAPITSDPATNTFDIPTTGRFAQVGTWTVKTIDNRGVGRVSATFSALSPTSPNADLTITKSGPSLVSAGSSVTFTLTATNAGPDDAQDVAIKDAVPANTTFVSVTQTAGPVFACTTAPDADGIDTTTCTISGLPANATASFMLVYNVGADTPDGTILFNSANISSATNEVNSSDNSAGVTVSVSGAAPCALTCPSNVTQDNDAGLCGAVVDYSSPGGTNCNGVTCSPPSGSFFPTGPATTVTCVGDTGNPCSFTVTIHDTRPPVDPTITCPSNVTVDEEFAGAGSATVNYASPTTTGNCVTFVCSPPSGSSFPAGTTTVSCTATDSANNSVSCSFTVTVNGSGCTLTCPGDVTQTAAANQCNAVVDYPPPTGNECGTVTCTPASGSTFPAGVTVVTCTSSQGSSCSFNVTVNPATAPTITTCAANKTVSVDANCEAAIPNLTGQVVATGCGVTLSQSPAAGTLVGPGPVTVTITAENAAGETTCTAIVTVVDNTPPVITTCPSASGAAADATCHAAVPSVTGSVAAFDNCTDPGTLTITQSPAAGTPVGVGTTTITVTVKDAANNAATCTTTFTVVDTTPPTAICKNITVALDAGGNAAITGADVDNGSSDNCGIVSRTVTPNTFTCANKGPNAVTLTVKDSSNNMATCTATVTVVDNLPPTITCQADIVVDFDPAAGGAVVTYTAPVGTDNCPGATTSQTAGLPSGATFPLGITTNTFRVTDAGGLTATCSFKVIVALTSIVGLDSVSITGAGFVDSYDSAGGYPATKSSLAKILSNGTITLGNSGKVFGSVRSTRAGVVLTGASQITGNATAGTTVSVSGSSSVGGTITNNQLAPVITLPAVPACGPPYSPNSGISGTYSYNPSTGDLNLSGVNNATLANGTYCFHNVTLTNSAQLRVNGLVVIKLTGTLNAGGATSIVNTTGVPSNLRILSSYAGSNGVTLINSTTTTLVIYAPGTNVTISGAVPLFGTVAGKTVTVSNSGMIHYDAQLKNAWPDIWALILGL
jgi:uncharacterized repeat protein (TIGR01451 family)